MKSPEKQNEIWILASLAAPIAHTASGLAWTNVLAATLLAVGLRWVLTRLQENELARMLYSVFCILILGVSLQWMKQCWPNQKDIEWILGILLVLGAVLAFKGKKCTGNASAVLWWMTAFLLGSILISSLREIKLRNLVTLYGKNQKNGFIKLTMLMSIPKIVEERKENQSSILPLMEMALICSVCAGGILTYSYAAGSPAPFYELSRSIRLFGIMDRMEALAWLGMMLGTFLYMTLLLTGALRLKKDKGPKVVIIGAALLWTALYNLCLRS